MLRAAAVLAPSRASALAPLPDGQAFAAHLANGLRNRAGLQQQIADFLQNIVKIEGLEHVGQVLLLEQRLDRCSPSLRHQEEHAHPALSGFHGWRQGQLLQRQVEGAAEPVMPTLAITSVQSPVASTCKAELASGTICTRHSSASSTWRKAAWLAGSSSIIRMLTGVHAQPLRIETSISSATSPLGKLSRRSAESVNRPLPDGLCSE